MSVQVVQGNPDPNQQPPVPVDPAGPAAAPDTDLQTLSLDPKSLLSLAGNIDLFPQAAVVKAQLNARNGHRWGDVESDISLLGAPASKLTREQCYLMMIVLDDSGSMDGYERAVIDAANGVINDYKQAKEKGEISSDVLVAVGTLNHGLIYPYTMIQDAPTLTSSDYVPSGNTPLYSTANSACALQMAKTGELITHAVTSKTITLFMTDGHATDTSISSDDVKTVVDGIREKNRSHIVGGIYLGDADKHTFEAMGIPDEWILSGKGSAADLIRAFSRFSKMSRSSKNAAAQTADPNAAGVVIS